MNITSGSLRLLNFHDSCPWPEAEIECLTCHSLQQHLQKPHCWVWSTVEAPVDRQLGRHILLIDHLVVISCHIWGGTQPQASWLFCLLSWKHRPLKTSVQTTMKKRDMTCHQNPSKMWSLEKPRDRSLTIKSYLTAKVGARVKGVLKICSDIHWLGVYVMIYLHNWLLCIITCFYT